jgi:hypothetical protein
MNIVNIIILYIFLGLLTVGMVNSHFIINKIVMPFTVKICVFIIFFLIGIIWVPLTLGGMFNKFNNLINKNISEEL